MSKGDALSQTRRPPTPVSGRSATSSRKRDHLAICLREDVEFHSKRTWLECVELVHCAVPSFGIAQADTSLSFLGRRLSAPILIGAMTGGTPEGGRINRLLAAVAEEMGVGLGLGSQRAMLEDRAALRTFCVRDVAPGTLILGNLGITQAAGMRPADVRRLMDAVGADAMCIHLNTAMELFQKDGDGPPSGAWLALRRLSRELREKLIVKETGCGISREVVRRLAELGIRTIDVSGAGGTSWVRVENRRRGGAPAGLEDFEEWGIPTAASLLEVRPLRLRAIASGGIRTGLDLAKAIALGAYLGAISLPVLRAADREGASGARRYLEGIAAGLRTAMVLTGCRTLSALRRAPVVVQGPLREWVEQRGLWRIKR